MRNYENSNDFNSYRSGHERSRLDDITHRAASHQGYGGHTPDTSGSAYSNRSVYGGSQSQGSSPYSSSQAGWSNESNYNTPNRSQGSWTNQSSQPQNRNWNQPSSHQGSSYNTGGYGSYGNRDDRDLFDRAGDAIERTGNRISNAWDRWTDDDDRRNRGTWGPSNVNRYGSGTSNYGSSNHGTSGYGSGSSNYGTGSYGSGYGAGSSNYGSTNYGGYNRGSYDPDRYSSVSRRSTSDWDRDRDTDRGFFERVGDRISNAWDRVVGDEDERNFNTGNRWTDSDRSRWSDSDRNRTTRGSSSYGPPYSYGSSSDRDYQW